jgi:uncharacterized membrane protein YqaE (UPF0057 family)
MHPLFPRDPSTSWGGTPPGASEAFGLGTSGPARTTKGGTGATPGSFVVQRFSLDFPHHERDDPTMDILRIILSVLLPPLGVFLQVGIGLHFWLNILLTLLGYIPGLIHAIWIIAKR